MIWLIYLPILLMCVAHRRVLYRGSDPGRQLSTVETAYLHRGPQLSVLTSLTLLGQADAIRADGLDQLRHNGPLPAGASALDKAVYEATADRTPGGARKRAPAERIDEQLRTSPLIVRELNEIAVQLGRDGLLFDRRTVRIARFLPKALLAVAAVELVADRRIRWQPARPGLHRGSRRNARRHAATRTVRAAGTWRSDHPAWRQALARRSGARVSTTGAPSGALRVPCGRSPGERAPRLRPGGRRRGGHLLPLPRSWEAVQATVANVRRTQSELARFGVHRR